MEVVGCDGAGCEGAGMLVVLVLVLVLDQELWLVMRLRLVMAYYPGDIREREADVVPLAPGTTTELRHAASIKKSQEYSTRTNSELVRGGMLQENI